jgi:small subunit ribosomal protein S20
MAKDGDYTQVSGDSVVLTIASEQASAGNSIDKRRGSGQATRLFWGPLGTLVFQGVCRLANTKSAEKAARQSTVHRARNDALTSQLRSAIRKATLALKAGKHEEAASALAAATPVIDSMVNKGIIHRNKAARHKSRLTKQVRALAK